MNQPASFPARTVLAAVSLLAAIGAWAQTTRYVSPTGSSTPPYNSWGTAATNIQMALDAAADNDTIWVADGVYGITGQVSVVKAVALMSVNGPTATEIVRIGVAARILYVNHASAHVAGFTLRNGAPGGNLQGSGLYMDAGTVSNCIVTGGSHNRASAVYLTGAATLFTHSTVTNNDETGNSGGCGGVRMLAGATMRACLLADNRAGSESSGIMGLSMQGNTLVESCVIRNQRVYNAATPTIAVRMQTGDTIRNCLIADNPGRGLHMAGGTAAHLTLSGNRYYPDVGNGLFMTNAVLLNSIIYYNGISDYPQTARDVEYLGGSVSNVCSGVLLPGSGNLDAPPQFRNPAAGDFTLMPGSPCIDSGLTLPTIPEDLQGTARPLDGDGDGVARYDLGCYEAPAATNGVFRIGFTVSTNHARGPLTITFTPYASGSNTVLAGVGWDFGDGGASNRADLAPVSRTYGPGYYTPTLTATNAALATAFARLSNGLHVAGTDAYVSPAGSHTPPFDTWARAATNIPAALNAILTFPDDIRTVWVGPGTYTNLLSVNVTTPVRVIGTNGPAATIATRGAGAARIFYLNHAQALVAGFTALNGAADGNLGGSGFYVGAGTVSNCIVTGGSHNRASAVYLTGAASLLTHSLVSNNTETGNSGGCGGVRLLAGATMRYCTITENRPGSEANGVMGVYMHGNATVSNCFILNQRVYNPSTAHQALFMQAGDTVRNCLIANNPGRGVAMAGGTLENCTITRNSMCGDAGNGLSQAGGTVRNCIIWDNGVDNSKNVLLSGGTLEYTDTNPAQPGTGNLNADPLFRNPASGEFHLDPASPMINVGTNLPWMLGAKDLDHSNRVQALIVDLGCFEAPDPAMGPLTCNFDAAPTEGLTNVQAVFASSASGANPNLVYWRWSFGDGATLEGNNLALVTNLYLTPGSYDVSLTVSNDTGETATRTKPGYIYVAPAVAYVATNGLHQPPFDTWAKAATNLQAAIDAARVSDSGGATLVLVSNGVYLIDFEISVLKGIPVLSVNGPEATVVARSGATSCRIFLVNHSNAFLAGFTAQSGAPGGYNQGSGIFLTAGTVSNCVITDCTQNRASALLMNGPNARFTHGRVRNNRDTGNSGGCGGVVMTAGRLEWSVIAHNRGGSSASAVGGLRLTGGEVWHTLLVSNTYGTGASGSAGGAALSGGRLVNCLVLANQGCGVAQSGGAVLSSTIARNSLEGLAQSAGGITNTILTLNNGGGINISGGGGTIRFCCSPDLPQDPGGSGNINLDPAFVDPGSGYGTNLLGGDFRLTLRTSCLNAGQNEDWMLTGIDLDGMPRLLNGRVEIGAYEFKPSHGTVLVVR